MRWPEAGKATWQGPAVLLVAYHFAPENVSGTHRPLHFAQSLLEAGWDVHVLTAARDAAEAVDPALEDVFPHPERIHRVGKRRTLGDYHLAARRRLLPATAAVPGAATEVGNGGAAEMPAPPASVLRRHIRAWDAYPDLHKGWRANALAAGVALGREISFAAVMASGPPWTALEVGEGIARRLGSAFVADFRDPWTMKLGAYDRYEIPWLRRRAEQAESRLMRRAQLVIFNSPSILEASLHTYPPPIHAPRCLILNGSSAPRRQRTASFPAGGPLVIRHFGTLYRGRSFRPLLDTLQSLVSAGALKRDDVVIEQFGIDETEAELGDSHGIPIRRFGTVTHAEAVRLMMEPALLLLVQPDNFSRQIPTKLFEYLCTGNPLVVQAGGHSAPWTVARDYPRAILLDEADSQGRTAALGDFVSRWRTGQLVQARAVEDTAGLTKRAVGEELVRALEKIVPDSPKPSRGAARRPSFHLLTDRSTTTSGIPL